MLIYNTIITSPILHQILNELPEIWIEPKLTDLDKLVKSVY